MRTLYVLAGLIIAFLAGGFAEDRYGWPFGLIDALVAPPLPARPACPAGHPGTAVPHYSDVQGLQDAPRSEKTQGATTDLQRCIQTMVLRRESEAEAKQVCSKIISGIGG